MDISIRPLTVSDIPSLPALLAQVSSCRDALDPAAIAEELARQSHWFPFVACLDDGRIVGYAELHRLYTAARGSVARIEYVVIDELYRRRRIGEMLCRALVATAMMQGCARIELHTRRPAARCLYEKNGFKESDGSRVMFISL